LDEGNPFNPFVTTMNAGAFNKSDLPENNSSGGEASPNHVTEE